MRKEKRRKRRNYDEKLCCGRKKLTFVQAHNEQDRLNGNPSPSRNVRVINKEHPKAKRSYYYYFQFCRSCRRYHVLKEKHSWIYYYAK